MNYVADSRISDILTDRAFGEAYLEWRDADQRAIHAEQLAREVSKLRTTDVLDVICDDSEMLSRLVRILTTSGDPAIRGLMEDASRRFVSNNPRILDGYIEHAERAWAVDLASDKFDGEFTGEEQS